MMLFYTLRSVLDREFKSDNFFIPSNVSTYKDMKILSFLTCPYSKLCRASLKWFHCVRGHIRGNFCKLWHCMPYKMRLDSWSGPTRTGIDHNYGWDQRPKNCSGHWQNSCCWSNLNLMSCDDALVKIHNVTFWRNFVLSNLMCIIYFSRIKKSSNQCGIVVCNDYQIAKNLLKSALLNILVFRHGDKREKK